MKPPYAVPIFAVTFLVSFGSVAPADELAPLGNRQDLVEVAEPLPDSTSLVTPPEPLPPPSEPPRPLPPLGLLQAVEEAEVLETIDRWLVAWWQQQVEDYLSFYAEDFEVPRSLDRASWEEQRRRRLAAPRFIAIDIEAQEVVALSSGRYRARFIQHYRSDNYRDTVLKVLDFTREDGRWKIAREESKRPLLSSAQARL